MANVGVEPIPMMPGSYSRKVLVWLCRSVSRVLQVWPRGGTYCRSSSQRTQWRGGAARSAYCVPQAVQMNKGIASGPFPAQANHSSGAAFGRRTPECNAPPRPVGKRLPRLMRLENIEFFGFVLPVPWGHLNVAEVCFGS